MRANDKYILVDNKPVPEPDLMKWGQWMQTGDRIVKQDKLPDGTFVSTVFLGLDHSFSPDGPPLLYETMIFRDDEDDQEQWRYSTLEEAKAGHLHALEVAKQPYKEDYE